MWIFERDKVWENLNYLLEKCEDSITRDKTILEIIQESRHLIINLQAEIKALEARIEYLEKTGVL